MFETATAPPVDALAAVSHPDPYPWYRQLREERPLYFDAGLQLWIASSHAVVEAALRQPALRVRPPGEPVPPALQGTAAGEVFARLVRMTDGDFHAAHKPAVLQAVRRWTLADVARASAASVADLLPRVTANNLLDRLPVQTMARLLQCRTATWTAPASRCRRSCGASRLGPLWRPWRVLPALLRP